MRRPVYLTLCCLCMVAAIGCDAGGGATAVVDVKVKLSDTEVVVVEPDKTDGDSAPVGFGSFTGQVVLGGSSGKLPLKVLIEKGAAVKDAEVCSAGPVPNELLEVGSDNGVKNVFVYLKKAPKGTDSPVPEEELVFDQKGCRFEPHCMFIRVGQKVRVKNDDGTVHNTHTYPGKNDPFNELVKSNDREGAPLVYEKAETKPFNIGCDFHTWMKAYHLVLDHPFAAVTKADGSFEIKNLPAGEHKFIVWHEAINGSYLTQNLSVTITADTPTNKTITLPLDKLDL